MPEKLRLKWNDFQENISSVFKDLREDSDFTDVTLACEGAHLIKADKVILSADLNDFLVLAEELQLKGLSGISPLHTGERNCKNSRQLFEFLEN